MNLVIDIGNTRIKAGLFNGPEQVELWIDERAGKQILDFLKQRRFRIDRCLISRVANMPKNLKKIQKYTGVKSMELMPDTPLPFVNSYTTKSTLGNDRIAAIAGACALFPSKNVLVIDAGTAITYDLKTASEEYLGGNISPGLAMRFRALNQYTANLPLVEPSDEFSLFGDSTITAIQNGVQNAIVFEINGYLESLRNKYGDLMVILTGGDAHFFDNKLKKPIFVVSDLTLIGLNFILQYNAEKV